MNRKNRSEKVCSKNVLIYETIILGEAIGISRVMVNHYENKKGDKDEKRHKNLKQCKF